MSAKDKEKTFQEKLKQFFRINKGGAGNIKGRLDFVLTPEIERDLSPDTPLNQRTKLIKELSDVVLNNRLEDNAIEKLWKCLQDLLHRDVSKEVRHNAFYFFRCLVQGQYEKLGIMRAHFFRVIKEHDLPEDTGPRLELMQSLTENGKDILYFEEEVGPFLLQWMSDMTGIGKTYEFLSMLVNVIKFNAAYIDDDVIAGLVMHTCYLSCCSNSQQVVLACLQVLDTVVCYSNLPSDSLPTFISALCRTVNAEEFCQSSWRIMRNLLGTHMGHSALYTMCRILQEHASLQDIHLLRGAVFYIGMGLWGTKSVTSLKYTPTSVLPSFRHAIESQHTVVIYEVMLSIQRLVNKYGLELDDPAWDVVLDIIEAIIIHIEMHPQNNGVPLVANHLHDTLCTVEQLIELGQFTGSVCRVFELIERCSPVRPESSVLRLVNYLAGSIDPTRSHWLKKLNSLLERYYKQEKRTNIRVKVLDVLSSVVHCNRSVYEDELIEKIVVPYIQHIDSETDIIVRNAAAQLLVDLCLECENKRCLELMDILEKLLNRPYEVDGVSFTNEADVIDVKTVVLGLIKIFTTKLYQLPSSHAIKAYKLLVNHVETHYHKPVVLDDTSSIRYMIFECFLQLRADSLYQLGYPKPGTKELCYSPYIIVDHKQGDKTSGSISPPPMSPAPTPYPPCVATQMSLTHACKAVIVCLKQEKDWKVLQLLLKEVPYVMQNKALILSKHGNDVDMLAGALIAMVSDKSLPDTLRNTTSKFTRSEFHGHVFPVLTSLASYHAYLEPNLQQRLIKCLEFGLVSRCARQCITALTTCTLEMRDSMYKLLPEVLLNLSKISATIHIAIPILEFLSTLTRLPKVFASFVGDQYMAVFAIALPYTNPFKYNHYTVSLAHHVIAVWFLKCRLPFRRDFVKFITTGLRANVILPFEEGQIMKPDLVNEDSSSRKRSSSLTEQGSRRSVRTLAPSNRAEGRPVDMKPPIDEALMNFHVELTETCIDLMARYTFSTCAALPKRLPTAEFLLNGGQSMTWLLGTRLITVTTSGCSQKALKNGVCDKCWLLCRTEKEPSTPDATSNQDGTAVRHKAAVQRSNSNDMAPAKEESNVSSRLSRQMSVDVNSSRPSTQVLSNSTATTSSPVDESGKKSFGTQDAPEPEPSKLDQLIFGLKGPGKHEREFCACWCQGWAEIYVRRPTGDMSWVMRIQNPNQLNSSSFDFPLEDITSLFMPSEISKHEEQFENLVSEPKINSENLAESDYDAIMEQHFEGGGETSPSSFLATASGTSTGPIGIPGTPVKTSPSRRDSQDCSELELSYEDTEDVPDAEGLSKARNPVRRSNSSPEMSASWKNAFLNREKDKEGKQERERHTETEGSTENEADKKSSKQTYSKDQRVSCEAIPEEIGGVSQTPPSSEGISNVSGPSYLTCQSYPGPAPGSVTTASQTSPVTRTVPTSPTSVVSPPSSVLSSIRSTPTQSTPTGATQPLAAARPPQSPSSATRAATSEGSKVLVRDLKSSPDTQPLTIDTSSKTTRSIPVSVGSKDDQSRPDPSALPPLALGKPRDRGYTISVMSPVRKPRMDWSAACRENSPRSKDTPRSGISPSFVFLQLYHATHFGSTMEKPLLLSQSQVVQRAMKNFDRIPPYETHKVGVIYVGRGQANNEAEILQNQFGSVRYAQFLQRLGTLIKLKDADPQNTFLGGLERNGNDGKFAYIWQDDVMQVTFHVATLMPTKESDPLCNGKKLHIGNDFVTIVYNESGEEFNIHTVKGQFIYACVVVQPLDQATNIVTVKTREELSDIIGHSEPKIMSDQNVAILARQLALHANLASMVSRSLRAQGQNPYASNWLERLRQIKRLRNKVMQETATSSSDSSNGGELIPSPPLSRRVHMDDFTEYT